MLEMQEVGMSAVRVNWSEGGCVYMAGLQEPRSVRLLLPMLQPDAVHAAAGVAVCLVVVKYFLATFQLFPFGMVLSIV